MLQELISHKDDIQWMLEHSLTQALKGPHTAYHLSGGLASLQSRAMLEAPRLCSDERDGLLYTIGRLGSPVADLFHDFYGRSYAAQGLASASVLVQFCGIEPSLRRSLWPANEISQANRFVRWLRNSCHNIALTEELEMHAKKTRCAGLKEGAGP